MILNYTSTKISIKTKKCYYINKVLLPYINIMTYKLSCSFIQLFLPYIPQEQRVADDIPTPHTSRFL